MGRHLQLNSQRAAVCCMCGGPATQRRGAWITRAVCGEACRAAYRQQWYANKRATPSYLEYKRKARAKRRAERKGSTGQAIDPIAILDRDGWKCQLCGKDTPRELRGSLDDSAPEVDHIIPYAAGGTHVWGNLQCACRRCNHLKGAST